MLKLKKSISFLIDLCVFVYNLSALIFSTRAYGFLFLVQFIFGRYEKDNSCFSLHVEKLRICKIKTLSSCDDDMYIREDGMCFTPL